MVIDTSAIFAAITGESDSSIYRSAIVSAPLRLISAVTLLETRIVLVSRSGSNSIPILRELIERAGIAVAPLDEPMVEVAFDAFKRYGKGQGHKAQLNIIDCGAYALAKTRDLPLLFKGSDFAATDRRPALPSRLQFSARPALQRQAHARAKKKPEASSKPNKRPGKEAQQRGKKIGARANPGDAAILTAFTADDRVIAHRRKSIQEYYDGAIRMIDSDDYRREHGITHVTGKLYNGKGRLL